MEFQFKSSLTSQPGQLIAVTTVSESFCSLCGCLCVLLYTLHNVTVASDAHAWCVSCCT